MLNSDRLDLFTIYVQVLELQKPTFTWEDYVTKYPLKQKSKELKESDKKTAANRKLKKLIEFDLVSCEKSTYMVNTNIDKIIQNTVLKKYGPAVSAEYEEAYAAIKALSDEKQADFITLISSGVSETGYNNIFARVTVASARPKALAWLSYNFAKQSEQAGKFFYTHDLVDYLPTAKKNVIELIQKTRDRLKEQSSNNSHNNNETENNLSNKIKELEEIKNELNIFLQMVEQDTVQDRISGEFSRLQEKGLFLGVKLDHVISSFIKECSVLFGNELFRNIIGMNNYKLFKNISVACGKKRKETSDEYDLSSPKSEIPLFKKSAVDKLSNNQQSFFSPIEPTFAYQVIPLSEEKTNQAEEGESYSSSIRTEIPSVQESLEEVFLNWSIP